jgi:hypothetical protein
MSHIALAPRKGGACILPAALMPADIIVSTTKALPSKVIKASTASQVSHVMLYIGKNTVIEAISKGVVRRPLEEALFDATLAVAYRYPGLDWQATSNIIGHADYQVDQKKKYDYAGAAGGGSRANPQLCEAIVGSLISPPMIGYPGMGAEKIICGGAARGGWQSDDKYYCSELVLESFQKAGKPIISGSPNTSVPQDIVKAYERGVLKYVGHLR